MKNVARHLVVACGLLLAATVASAGQAQASKANQATATATPKGHDNYDALLTKYLLAARALESSANVPADATWMTGLFSDLRARRVNDLVTIRVVENVTAAGAADSSVDKNSKAAASLTNYLGIETKFPGWLDPTSLASLSGSTQFKGGGSTARTGSLTAVITARVVEVLPNRDLVLEGIREVDINGDRQIIVLTGIVRTADIGPGNVVPSTAVGQMQIRYFGNGLIKDSLQPGWLVRILNKVF